MTTSALSKPTGHHLPPEGPSMHKTTQNDPPGGKSRRDQARGPTLYPPLFTIFPEELWREIFLHCLPADEFIVPSRTSAPLLLCQVCIAWRVSAITMPDLWTSISIGSHFDDQGCFPRIELINIWLLRAKNRPLSISYGSYPHQNKLAGLLDEYNPDEEEVHEVFRAVVRHIGRWKSFRLCPMDIIEGSLPPIPQSGAPRLQKLCLFLPPCVESGECELSSSDRRLYDIWRNSPLLDTFSFLADDIILGTEEGADALCATLHIRWVQLTSLIITVTQIVPECLDILEECPNLLDCAFLSIHADQYDDDDISYLYPTPILLTHLNSLVLKHSGHTHSNYLTNLLLANTTMPGLRQLTIRGEDLEALDPFAAFISRSSCHIEDLTLYDVIIDDACLLQCLELLSQTLFRLCIRYYSCVPVKCMSDIVMQRLTRDESTNAILGPKLEIIDLDYRAVKVQAGMFSKMISSRFDVEEYGITLLKRVLLRFGDEAPMDCVQDATALMELTEEGVSGEVRLHRIGGLR